MASFQTLGGKTVKNVQIHNNGDIVNNAKRDVVSESVTSI